MWVVLVVECRPCPAARQAESRFVADPVADPEPVEGSLSKGACRRA